MVSFKGQENNVSLFTWYQINNYLYVPTIAVFLVFLRVIKQFNDSCRFGALHELSVNNIGMN